MHAGSLCLSLVFLSCVSCPFSPAIPLLKAGAATAPTTTRGHNGAICALCRRGEWGPWVGGRLLGQLLGTLFWCQVANSTTIGPPTGTKLRPFPTASLPSHPPAVPSQTSIAAVAARLDRVAVMRGMSLHGSPDPGPGQGLVSPSRANPPHYTAAPSPAATPRDVTAFDARLELVQEYAQRLESPSRALPGRPGDQGATGPTALSAPPAASGPGGSGGVAVDWGGSGSVGGSHASTLQSPLGLSSARAGAGAGAGAGGPGLSSASWGWSAAPSPPSPPHQPHQPVDLSPAARQRALSTRLAVARAKSPQPLSLWPSSPRCIPHPGTGACLRMSLTMDAAAAA